MPTAPYAKLRANIASAGNLSGVLVGAAGASCQLSQDPAGLGSSFKYEITDYPEGFPCPSGWTESSLSGVYSYEGLTPPPFTLPALPLWGKMMFRLTVNNGDPGTSSLPKTQFVDSSTVISTPDPSGNAIEDIAYGETQQWDRKRKWMGPLKRNIRKFAKQSLPPYASVPDGYVLQLVGGVPTWMPGVASFSGDFAALAVTYGLTVRGFWRGDLGVSGTQGTGIAAWANQSGSASAISGLLANGLTVTAGLNGKAGLSANAVDQRGGYTMPAQSAPGTTNLHRWAIVRFLATPVGAGTLFISGSNDAIQVVSGQTSPAANCWQYNAGAGATTTGVVINQWYRLRASLTGGASDQIRIGAHAPAPTATTNTAPSTSRSLFADGGGNNRLNAEILGLLELEGTLANFLLFDADAGPKSQAFWTSAIEI